MFSHPLRPKGRRFLLRDGDALQSLHGQQVWVEYASIKTIPARWLLYSNMVLDMAQRTIRNRPNHRYIGHAPVQPHFFELLASGSVLDAHPLRGFTAYTHAVALAVVGMVPDLMALPRHLTPPFGVLFVFQVQLERFGAGTHTEHHRLCETKNHRPYRPYRSNLGRGHFLFLRLSVGVQ